MSLGRPQQFPLKFR